LLELLDRLRRPKNRAKWPQNCTKSPKKSSRIRLIRRSRETAKRPDRVRCALNPEIESCCSVHGASIEHLRSPHRANANAAAISSRTVPEIRQPFPKFVKPVLHPSNYCQPVLVPVRVHSLNNVPYQPRNLEARCVLGAYLRYNRPELDKTAQIRRKSPHTEPKSSGTTRVSTWLGT